MTSKTIRYYGGVKYWLAEDFEVQLKYVRPPVDIDTKWIRLTKEGLLLLREGYASDGPSGPTIDTASGMRAGWTHDGLYDLQRQGFLPREIFRHPSDKELRRLCRHDNMAEFRAQLWYESVRLCAEGSACASGGKPLYEAP